MKSDKVTHDSFREGFIVGYQLIKGINAGVPAAPGGKAAHAGTTPFLKGVRAGIRAGGSIGA